MILIFSRRLSEYVFGFEILPKVYQRRVSRWELPESWCHTSIVRQAGELDAEAHESFENIIPGRSSGDIKLRGNQRRAKRDTKQEKLHPGEWTCNFVTRTSNRGHAQPYTHLDSRTLNPHCFSSCCHLKHLQAISKAAMGSASPSDCHSFLKGTIGHDPTSQRSFCNTIHGLWS